jgi:biopolymer transport protein ExbD
MARRRPSQRRSFRESREDLNITPMMNLITILIPALLLSASFVAVSILEVEAPGDDPTPPEPYEALGLRLTVAEEGYTLTAANGRLAAEPSSTIPIVNRSVACTLYVGTRPPPRARNAAQPVCSTPDAEWTFWVFDTEALHQRLVALKERFPHERAIVIVAEPDVQYEAIADAMDASREYDDGGQTRPLFDKVLVSPGIPI